MTVGVRARAIAETALARGMSQDHVFQFDDAKQAIPQLTTIVGEGDVILVKASQGIRAERIVEALLQDPHTDKNELVRQDTMWQRK